jgi:hypothetical protein
MARLYFLLIPLLIATYLFALWSDWFTAAELNAVVKRPLYSEMLDLRKAGPLVWDIAPERLGFARGKVHLSLSLNLNALREIPESREAIDLRVKVVAESRQPAGQWQDRLLRDHYFKTNEPFSPAGSGLWESWGLGRAEYGLGGLEVLPGEEVRITLDVQVPDGRLMTGRPRLKLIAAHGPGDVPYPAFMRLVLREGGFWLSLALLAWLSVRAWRGGDHGR